MCTLLSLAIRAFLPLFGTILAVTSLPTQAEDLQFDLTGTAFTPGNGFFPGVGPFDISFVLDTQSGTRSLIFGTSNNPGAGCLGHFGINGASLEDVTILVAGQSIFAGDATAGYGGDIVAPVCTSNFTAGLVFTAGTTSVVWDFDPSPGISQAALLASNDPVATLFLNFQQYPSSGGLSGPSGHLNLDFRDVTVTPVGVPEPGALGLLVLGLTGVVLCGRKRISVRAPALSA